MSNIFITGGTGFLGSSLVEEILSSSDDTVHVLVRGKNIDEARARLLSVLKELSDSNKLDKNLEERIKVYVGDITQENFGLSQKTAKYLIDTSDLIYHSAAITELNLSLEKVRGINVEGTRNVLDFALACKKNGRLKKVSYISTAYVAGTKKCIFKEKNLDIGQDFNNTYEQSKYEAEKLANKYREKGAQIDIFRPSIILGRYKDGKALKLDMLYKPLRSFSLDLFTKIPVIEGSNINLINVDIAAKAIISITNNTKNANRNYHITSPKVSTLDYILDLASEHFGFKRPELVQWEKLDFYKDYSAVERKILEPYSPYFNYQTEFDMHNTLTELKKKEFAFPDFDKENFIRLFEYCDKVGFIKRKEKNAAVR
ncbi:MAG: SDR family oxidoreductase [Candidatus Omnitrophica bacterium]|nr:SDR family oxidoreductase [Candidatus Omnitrophota bacterium]